LVFAAIAACGDNDAEVAYRDGSRLVSQWLIADDGTRVPGDTIHDTMRDQDCYLQTWGDGMTRCTSAQGFVVFSDAACTQPVVIDAQVTAGAIATKYDPGGCGVTTAYEIGAMTTGTTWYFSTLTSCRGPYTSSDPIYSLGAQLDSGVFAKVDAIGPDTGSRLGSRSWASADGMRRPGSVYDNTLATACQPGDTECTPSTTSDVRYLDAACKQRVVTTYDNPCSQDAVYFDESDASCPDRQHYYRLGKAVAPAQIYNIDSTTKACTADTLDPTMHFWLVGDELSPAAMTRASSLGRRLQALYDRGDGVAVRTGRFFDSTVQSECYFQTATDGVTRCLPNGPGWAEGFSDAACTRPAMVTFVVQPKKGCGAAAPAPAFATGYTGSGTVVRVVTGPFHGGFYANNGSGCASVSYPDSDVYAVGDLVDPKSFVGSTMELGSP
jgi:hypothetical protein